MVMHARSGGRLEVMGLILGKIDGPTMVVMDVFAVPVEGTETRVNAQTEAYEYMSTYIESSKLVSSIEVGLEGKDFAIMMNRYTIWNLGYPAH